MPMHAKLQIPASGQFHRRIVLYAFLSILLAGGFLFFFRKGVSGQAALNDFMEYWAAGRIFLQGGNPYDPPELLAVQSTLGLRGSHPLMMWNPPWTLILIAPFALFPYPTAQAAWLIVSMLLLLWSADWFWGFWGGSASRRWLSWLGAVLFIPNGSALYLGQISPFMLFGLAGFLWGIQRKHYYLAGAVASLIAIKPHVLYAFWIFFLLWIWKERLWRVLEGFIASLCLCLLALSVFDPSITVQYLAALKSGSGPLIWQTPTWGVALRMLLPAAGQWLRFLPTIIGICLCAWLIPRWHNTFSWPRHLIPILLISIITTSFTWMFDWVVLLPLIVLFFKWFQSEPSRLWWIPLGFIFIEAFLFFQSARPSSNFYSIWLPPALAALYAVSHDKAGAGLSYKHAKVKQPNSCAK